MVKEKKRPGKKNRGNRHPSPQTRIEASKALKGNAFWEQRSKHGRDKLFESPKLMWEAACEYFRWVDRNPFKEFENKVVSNGNNSGSSIERATIPKKRPYTIQDLCRYLNCNTAYLRQFKDTKAYKEDKGFATVITDIEEVIYSQQFSGASSGFFNANIISRALGLIDKQDVTTAGEKIESPKFNVYNSAPPLASEEKEVDKKKK